MTDDPVADAAARAWRDESGRILPGLIRLLGDWALAEEALQDAFERALRAWRAGGVPASPGAWLTTAARRRALDLRRRRNVRRSGEDPAALSDDDAERLRALEAGLDSAVPDDQLRALFTCCHPALAAEAQSALMLATLGGLRTEEIAAAYLVPVPTMAQRLVRAKRKIRDAGIPFAAPQPEERSVRLPPVLQAVYLIFNAGYTASHGARLLRTELCAEAVRLAVLLTEVLPDEAEAHGLAALLRLQHARRDARLDADGVPVLLEEQDRTRWHHAEVQAGLDALDRGLALRRPGPYQIQAAIAALHMRAPSAAATDWAQIAALYAGLRRWLPTPVVALNHAAAVAMADGPASGLAMLEELAGEPALADYRYFHAARADLLRRLERTDAARAAYQRALELTDNPGERVFLRRRLDELDASSGRPG